jgi:hypothetical protein
VKVEKTQFLNKYLNSLAHPTRFERVTFAFGGQPARVPPGSPSKALRARMQATVDNLCAERDKLVGEQRIKYPGTNKVIKGPQMRLR